MARVPAVELAPGVVRIPTIGAREAVRGFLSEVDRA
jgi:hypothetical protein